MLKCVDEEGKKFYNINTRCSTEVNTDETHIKGKWGYCDLNMKGKSFKLFFL